MNWYSGFYFLNISSYITSIYLCYFAICVYFAFKNVWFCNATAQLTRRTHTRASKINKRWKNGEKNWVSPTEEGDGTGDEKLPCQLWICAAISSSICVSTKKKHHPKGECIKRKLPDLPNSLQKNKNCVRKFVLSGKSIFFLCFFSGWDA